MSSPFGAENALDPGNDFVRRWVGRLVEVDDAAGDVGFEVALERGGASWDWGEMSSANED